MYVVVTFTVALTNSVTLIVLRRGVNFRALASEFHAAAPRVIGDVVGLIVNDVVGHVAEHVVRYIIPTFRE